MHFGAEIMSSMFCSYYGYHPTASLHVWLKETAKEKKKNVQVRNKKGVWAY